MNNEMFFKMLRDRIGTKKNKISIESVTAVSESDAYINVYRLGDEAPVLVKVAKRDSVITIKFASTEVVAILASTAGHTHEEIIKFFIEDFTDCVKTHLNRR